eukprot:2055754-Alexandrium_andersonii.AAC.1
MQVSKCSSRPAVAGGSRGRMSCGDTPPRQTLILSSRTAMSSSRARSGSRSAGRSPVCSSRRRRDRSALSCAAVAGSRSAPAGKRACGADVAAAAN